jgi:hypothetical protein
MLHLKLWPCGLFAKMPVRWAVQQGERFGLTLVRRRSYVGPAYPRTPRLPGVSGVGVGEVVANK